MEKNVLERVFVGKNNRILWYIGRFAEEERCQGSPSDFWFVKMNRR